MVVEVNFFRCHKGYIINTDMVTEILPWGHKTYVAQLAKTKETALMTLEKAKEFRQKYCLNNTNCPLFVQGQFVIEENHTLCVWFQNAFSYAHGSKIFAMSM